MSTTDTHSQRAPVPPGWPGDDPTLPDDLDVLGMRWWWWVGRRTRARRPDALEGPGSRAGAGRSGGGRAEDGGTGDWTADDVVDVADDEPDLDGDDLGAPRWRWADRLRWRGAPPGDREPPDDDEVAAVDDDDLVAGVQPAGRVLVVLVATLVLALLVNVDHLVARVEAGPPSDARDRALSVLRPVQDVGNALQLTRVRDALDALRGDGDDDRAREAGGARGTDDAADSTSRGGGGDEREPGGEEAAGDEDGLRTPTADDPLRVWVGGDFMAQAIGRSLAAAGESTGVVETEVRYEAASGLTRPDYFDWPAAVDEALDDHDPEVVVLVVGVNDAQGIVRPDGTPAQVDEPGWADEYGRRVGELMDRLRGDGRIVVWIGPPPMREPGYSARMARVAAIHAEQAAPRPWVHVVDLAQVVGGPDGGYTEAVADPSSAEPVTVRQPDGIHLTDAGGDLVAAHVMDLLRTQVDLSGGARGDG